MSRAAATPPIHTALTGLSLGAFVDGGGTRFRFASRHAERMVLQLYAERDAFCPSREIDLERRDQDEWEVFVPGVGHGQRYLVRAEGPFFPEEGHRFDGRVPLVDPAARALTWSGGRPMCLALEDRFDWQGVARPGRPLAETILYELHVRGFTMHPSAGVARPGTFLGLCEKIPYLVDLGVTAVELLPVFEWNPHDVARRNPATGGPMRNYWGYSPIAWHAPAEHLASGGPPGHQVVEFQTMVRELHRAGLEVILDVVYNHSGEGDESRPTLSLRGLDNAAYYHHGDPRPDGHRGRYRDYTGCGNSMNAAHPLGRRLILESLRYWVTHMGVDGFRFDLASVMQRDERGTLHTHAPLLAEIANDPALRGTKLIAEPWDAAGGYQIGGFPAGWSEWNGRYRDDVRRFWCQRKASIAELVTRFAGSSDLYAGAGRTPLASVNFVTCHDGFTLRDLVSYDRKHNEQNGEGNRDGSDHEQSENHGCEGETDDPAIRAARFETARALIATLLLSQGVPMLNMGDERWRTQGGNNNAYCQDNAISWLDWSEPPGKEARSLHDLVKSLLALRRSHPALRRARFFVGRDHDGDGFPDVHWLGPDGRRPAWESAQRTVACLIAGTGRETLSAEDREDLLILINGGPEPVDFHLPRAPQGGSWKRVLDTGRHPTVSSVTRRYPLGARSLACFVAARHGDGLRKSRKSPP